MTRPVTVFEFWRPEGCKYNEPYQKRESEKGKFHGFSTEYEEFETGPGNYAIAIVELPDGTVITPIVGLIRFDDVAGK